MYREAEKLSEEVLKVHPADETAHANAVAARNSMQLRSNGMGRAMPEVRARPPLRVTPMLSTHRRAAVAAMIPSITKPSVRKSRLVPSTTIKRTRSTCATRKARTTRTTRTPRRSRSSRRFTSPGDDRARASRR